jgi:hypothetical protein
MVRRGDGEGEASEFYLAAMGSYCYGRKMRRIGISASAPFSSTRELPCVDGEACMQLLKPRAPYAVMGLVSVFGARASSRKMWEPFTIGSLA